MPTTLADRFKKSLEAIKKQQKKEECFICGAEINRHKNNLYGVIKYCSQQCRIKRHNKKNEL